MPWGCGQVPSGQGPLPAGQSPEMHAALGQHTAPREAPALSISRQIPPRSGRRRGPGRETALAALLFFLCWSSSLAQLEDALQE